MTGSELEALMKEKGINNSALASALGVHIATVSNWRRDKAPIPENRVGQIERIMGKIHERLPFEPEDIVTAPVKEIPMMKDEPAKEAPIHLDITDLTIDKIDALALLTGMEFESIIVDIIERNIDAYIGTKVRKEE